MRVLELTLSVDAINPNDVPRLGESFTLSLPRMDAPQEFSVAEVQVKRRYVGKDSGDDEGYVYDGTVRLEAVHEEEDDGDDTD